ncbi:carboxypeptidase-like regulatory domain-containing protein [Winogradskyella flava]|uniref:Carboxypeptidase-like regulatory domain-containing protein n=1 Tax=Winogradskyella flava TaxID=1884876 RepID=A0A842IVP2_9FLAO|nr:carboxypeptidase-like regulatory domain-containing protein [Winogradskyella flava]MBC2846014.1 carboxypeptidase-like regulatory domain-containing protein [Winogradskyella flava]
MKFIFLLIPFFVLSQEHKASGLVLDKDTKAPVPYVNISILKSQMGTSSDEDGSYSLIIKREDLEKKVKLSSLGYKDTTFVVSDFLKFDKIELSSLSEELEEVMIKENFKEKFLVINNVKKKYIVGGIGGLNYAPYIFALHFPFKKDYSEIDVIDKAKVHLNKVHFLGGNRSMPSKFRFRLFSVGKDSLPGADLIKEDIIITTVKNQREVEIDLSEYNLTFSEEGVYVAIEWLYIPFNAYEYTYTKRKSNKKYTEIRYAPRISWLKQKDKKYRLALFTSGQWLNFKMPYIKEDEYIIPAISLTLSN